MVLQPGRRHVLRPPQAPSGRPARTTREGAAPCLGPPTTAHAHPQISIPGVIVLVPRTVTPPETPLRVTLQIQVKNNPLTLGDGSALPRRLQQCGWYDLGYGSLWAQFGTPLLTLLGTLVGATIGAFTTWRTTHSALIANQRDSLLQLRREEYFNAIGLVYQMKQALQDVGAAISGRQKPGSNATDEEKLVADKQDESATAALWRLFEASNSLQLEVYRLVAVGSHEVRNQLENLFHNVDHYLMQQFSHEDHRFIGKAHMAAMEKYEADTQVFLMATRQDLQIDRVLDQ